MSEQPSSGAKQTLENQHEALLKKHAMEYTKLMKEFEEMKASGNGKNEEYEAKEKGWKKTMEEIFSLVKEMAGNTVEQKEEGWSLTVRRKQGRGCGSSGEDGSASSCLPGR